MKNRVSRARLLLTAGLSAVLAVSLGVGAAAAAPTEDSEPVDAPAVADPAAHPLGDLAPTPPMGWSSWNTFGCDISADLVKETADALVASGMAAAGYEYVNIDDCWSTMARSADGKLVPDPAKFPNGIKDVADYVHGLGLKLGIYSSAGTVTCAGYPASLGYEESDARQWAEWEVDLVKYDNCGDHQGIEEQERYQRMADAIAASGRDMLYSLCDWGEGQDWLWNGEDQVGHFYRTTYDIEPTWSIMMRNGDFQAGMAPYSGPNNWADPDMLVVGLERFLGAEVPGLPRNEARVHMGLWAITNSPLIAGNDVRSMEPWVREMLTNPRALAIDQDWSGQIGTRVRQSGDADVWIKEMSDGSTAVLLLNRGTEPLTIGATPEEIGIDAETLTVQDVWSGETFSSDGNVRARVAGHSDAFFIVSAGAPADAPALATFETVAPQFAAIDEPVQVQVEVHNDGTSAVNDVQLSLTVPSGFATSSPVTKTVAGLAPGQTATLSVALEPQGIQNGAVVTVATAAGWGPAGDRTELTDRATIRFATAPAAGTTRLSDLQWVDTPTNAWGPVEKNMSNGEQAAGDGTPLTIGGVVYEHGLGVHADSRIEYYLGERCTALTAQVGIDDEVGAQGSVEFIVMGDGDELARIPANGSQAAQVLDVDLTGVESLTLVADDLGQADFDHADWAAAELTCDDPRPVVDVVVETRCLASKVFLAVRASNGDAGAVSVTVRSPFGEKTFENVAAGTNAFAAFNARAIEVPAGSVEVEATRHADGANAISTAAYDARSCV
ncbi:NPCBM/NEW2 domain-containing protein [Agromyces laixinhei]|uniref:NPCBM/NEW2 domain-containing protein n=1 Tax=Agromyces laixinhei TaxID=2585717 RepID=UPI00143D87D0|nr:NPCBM/NEW2 domain-containing protein [Agromyces laixinhei]